MHDWDIHTHLVPATVVAQARSGAFGLNLDGGQLARDGGQLPEPAAAARAARERRGGAWAGYAIGTSAGALTLAAPGLEPRRVLGIQP